MPEGNIPQAGYTLKQKDLANTLDTIANEGYTDIYKGKLAETIVRGVKEAGGLIDFKDLENHS